MQEVKAWLRRSDVTNAALYGVHRNTAMAVTRSLVSGGRRYMQVLNSAHRDLVGVTMDNDFEELMHSYGLDPTDPDHLDELLYRIGVENTNDPNVFDPDNLYDKLSDFMDVDDECDFDDIDLIESEDC